MEGNNNKKDLDKIIRESKTILELSTIPITASAGTAAILGGLYATESELSFGLKIASVLIFSASGAYILRKCYKSYKLVRWEVENFYKSDSKKNL